MYSIFVLETPLKKPFETNRLNWTRDSARLLPFIGISRKSKRRVVERSRQYANHAEQNAVAEGRVRVISLSKPKRKRVSVESVRGGPLAEPEW